MWFKRRMLTISWAELIRNEEVKRKMETKKCHIIRIRKREPKHLGRITIIECLKKLTCIGDIEC